jgi:5-formyltetrahydrofolate cyclo-ligase
LGFDDRGWRLGYGGGFDDRTLAARPIPADRRRPAPAVKSVELVPEDHDVALETIDH